MWWDNGGYHNGEACHGDTRIIVCTKLHDEIKQLTQMVEADEANCAGLHEAYNKLPQSGNITGAGLILVKPDDESSFYDHLRVSAASANEEHVLELVRQLDELEEVKNSLCRRQRFFTFLVKNRDNLKD